MDLPELSLSELIAHNRAADRPEILDELVKRLQPAVVGIVARALRSYGACNSELVKDLTQDTFLKILSPKFKLKERALGRSDGEIRELIRVTTAHLVLDAIRKTRPVVPIEDSPEAPLHDNIEQKVLLQEIDAALKGILVPPNADRDYRIFWFHHRDQMTAQHISSLPGIGLTVKGVESVIFRLTAKVKEHLVGSKGISAGKPL